MSEPEYDDPGKAIEEFASIMRAEGTPEEIIQGMISPYKAANAEAKVAGLHYDIRFDELGGKLDRILSLLDLPRD